MPKTRELSLRQERLNAQKIKSKVIIFIADITSTNKYKLHKSRIKNYKM